MPSTLQQLQIMVNKATANGSAFTVTVRYFDQDFEAWKNNACPLDDPNFPVPGDHPMKNHPWNLGPSGRKHFMKLNELDP